MTFRKSSGSNLERLFEHRALISGHCRDQVAGKKSVHG